jgi:hypothetical protein
MIIKKEYQKPSIKFWSKEKLDLIEAKMSGSGGIGGQGAVIIRTSTARAIDDRRALHVVEYASTASLAARCALAATGDESVPKTERVALYMFDIACACAARCRESKFGFFAGDPANALLWFDLDLRISGSNDAVFYYSAADSTYGCYPASGGGSHPTWGDAAMIAFTTALGILGGWQVSVALGAVGILNSLIQHSTKAQNSGRELYREWHLSSGYCADAYQYFKCIVAAPLDATFAVRAAYHQGTDEYNTTNCAALFIVNGFYSVLSMPSEEGDIVIPTITAEEIPQPILFISEDEVSKSALIEVIGNHTERSQMVLNMYSEIDDPSGEELAIIQRNTMKLGEYQRLLCQVNETADYEIAILIEINVELNSITGYIPNEQLNDV